MMPGICQPGGKRKKALPETRTSQRGRFQESTFLVINRSGKYPGCDCGYSKITTRMFPGIVFSDHQPVGNSVFCTFRDSESTKEMFPGSEISKHPRSNCSDPVGIYANRKAQRERFPASTMPENNKGDVQQHPQQRL
jgi:hypothetical protein